ncbi:hypothetical protein FACS189499_06280 [Clostridia bacterium]|nr:hypothetical protein FACS1894208_09650 [Clostridia bacterium]GHV47910.1 hypothetical protein FACS189499_06280 [Clostridia bacterium]
MTLTEMKNVDIRTVNPDTLVDVSGISVNMDLPKIERMLEFASKAKNPYCFKSGKIIVKVSFADTPVTMDERMESYLRTI